METMTSKEFDLLISLILSMLENGEVEKVIALLKEAKSKKNDKSDN